MAHRLTPPRLAARIPFRSFILRFVCLSPGFAACFSCNPLLIEPDLKVVRLHSIVLYVS